MNSRSARSLVAAERVRQIAVDDAKRALGDAIYVSNAARKKVETLQAQATSAEAHALALLQTPGRLDLGSIGAAQRYRSWQQAQLRLRPTVARPRRACRGGRALGARPRACAPGMRFAICRSVVALTNESLQLAASSMRSMI